MLCSRHQFGYAKIRHLHAALPIQQDILRLDVAVDDALVVGILEGVANLRHDRQRLARRHPPAVHQPAQTHPVHEFHQEVEKAVRPAGIIDGHNARMIQPGQRLGFPGKPLGKRRVTANARRQDLQRRYPVQFLLADLIDHSHAAPTQDLQNLELREMRRQFRG